MDRQARVRRNRVIVLVAAATLVFFTTACTCCWMPEAVRRAGSFGRAVPWRNWTIPSLGQVEASEQISQRFSVDGDVSLQVHVGVGDVRIEAGTGNVVEVRGSKRAWGADRAAAEARLEEFEVDVRQDGANTVVIETDGPRAGEAHSPQVDLVVVLPRRADVRAVVNVGSLEARGVEGTLDLTSNVGEVLARNVALTGSSRFVTNVGTVAVRLPRSASFELDARSSVGSVSCEFPLQDERSSSTLVGKSLSGRVGEASAITLTLRANTGDVRVERG